MLASIYVQEELTRREIEKEKRDRIFWIKQFGGEVPPELEADFEATENGAPAPTITITESLSEDDLIDASPLTRGLARG